ncbi:MAG: NADH-quinone oxidoreductase subunit F, partial [Bacteroidetes bacterium]|nr:NADH-quinone oxidoreductase subunit F [Bacteroidota bacterium]
MIAEKSFLVKNVLQKSEKETLSAETLSQLSIVRNEEKDYPVIFVGAGTCGLGAGASETIKKAKKYIEDHNIKADIIPVGCIGLCSSEPIMDIKLPGKKRISFEAVTGDKVTAILTSVFEKTLPDHPVLGQFREQEKQSDWEGVSYLDEHSFFKPQVRIVLENCGVINPESIEEYIARGGYKAYLNALKIFSRAELCDFIEKSGLRGRGGGGFPTGKKWKFALGTEADQKYLICNADEGDPGAFMDRAVIEGDPHRLLEGMALAAYAIGATKAYVYIRAEYPLAIERLVIAIAQAKEYGLLGKNIFETGIDL